MLQRLCLRTEFNGAQDYDLALRAVAQIREAEVVHIPKVLYHWRCHSASTSSNPQSKEYAYEAGRRAVADFCKNAGWQAEVSGLAHLGFYRVNYEKELFGQRPDVGVLAGPLPPAYEKGALLKKRQFVSGIYQTDARMLYAGLRDGFSGPMHRAALQQDVEYADLRSMRVRQELQPLYEAALARVRVASDAVLRRESMAFCETVRQLGYRILWDPKERQFEDNDHHSEL